MATASLRTQPECSLTNRVVAARNFAMSASVSCSPSACQSAATVNQSTPLDSIRICGTTRAVPSSSRRTRSVPKYATPGGRRSQASANSSMRRRRASIHHPSAASGQSG